MTAAPPIPKLCGAARHVRAACDGAGVAHKTNGSARLAAPVAVAPAQLPPTVFINIQRPLMSVWGVALLLNQNEEFVERLVEGGELAWGFNIAGPGSRQRCVRIFGRCVLDYRNHVKNDYSAPVVLNAIFPEARQRFCAREVAYIWHCGAEQVRILAKQGALKMLPGGDLRGPNSRAYFSRTVLADFLTSRRIT
jgi:hypothetical protein